MYDYRFHVMFMYRTHTLTEAILGGIKVDNCLLITNDDILSAFKQYKIVIDNSIPVLNTLLFDLWF